MLLESAVRIVFAICIGVVYCGAGYGQKINTAKLDSLFNALEENNMALGSLAISRNGKMIYQRAIGYSCIDSANKNPTALATRYRVGSVTKMFTAVMIFQLVEEGKITLDKKLGEYFPALPGAFEISIGDLLDHRSGLHNYSEGTNFIEKMDTRMTQDELLKMIGEKSLQFQPGSKAEYSNSNYLLLSYIIEKADEKPYSESLDNRIVSRLKLKDTYYGGAIDRGKREASSYKYANGKWEAQKETELSNHHGAGAVVSTAGDMIKFIEGLFNYKLVSERSVRQMKTLKDGYGMGLFPFEHGAKLAFGHNGRIEEFYSSVRYFAAEKLSVVYLTNGILYPRTDIIDAVLRICFNEPVELPFAAFSPVDLEKFAGSYSSSSIPIVVNCSVDSGALVAETQGTKFVLAPVKKNYFMHREMGYFFEFFPERKELLVKETDNVYVLKDASK